MGSVHKPCLASAAVTSSAKVASWGDSSRLMLPEEETLLSRRGDATLDLPGDWVMISAPWSTRAFACSRKFSFWLSILTLPPPGTWWALSSEPTLAWAFSLKSSFTLSIFTRPPPGLWRIFFKEPHFEVTWLRSIFLVTICTFPPPAECLMLSLEPHLDWTLLKSIFLFKILTCPPLGWYLILSVDPILDLTFFRSGSGWLISRSCLGVAGDFGGVRMIATFFSLGTKMADLGVPGVWGVLG